MTKRIFHAIFAAVLAVLLLSFACTAGLLFSRFSKSQMEQLRVQTELASRGLETEGESYILGLRPKNYRITWVSNSGEVLFDSSFDVSKMENHLDREEIKEALETGTGESTRYSDTFTKRLLYFAKRLDDGTVLRLSISQSTVLTLVYEMTKPMLMIFAALALLSLLLARWLSKKIVGPLEKLDLDDPLSNEGYDELSPFLRRIDSQQKQLKMQYAKLQKKRTELETVAENMNEGLLLIDSKGILLSMNPAAAEIFNASDELIGLDILNLDRSLEMQELVAAVLEGKRKEKNIQMKNAIYQLSASPVLSGKNVLGAAIFIFDVTEKERSEQMRREFTANVSHELKTPLQTISGYAELMQNGLVKNDDMVPFAGKIYSTAKQMICLVEDIIKLSRLDEGAKDMQSEEVDLYSEAKAVIASLAPQAEQTEVSFDLSGSSAVVNGIPQLINSVIYNLCDNAIKYNRKGGRVDVSVFSGEGFAAVKVSDTGIGMEMDQQERVFERFYRVDKSHSKEVGGTGLGLSIVKHAAIILGAEILLESKPGEGTTVTVKFKK